MNNGARLALAGLGLLLSACQMVGPDYQVPGMRRCSARICRAS
ncbi:hypothetical protein PBOI14_02030 [Pseudomonas sp. Boi14]|nr:hypothetical protein PBOI14_02030 [Pseudomonas sp. Boi14]